MANKRASKSKDPKPFDRAAFMRALRKTSALRIVDDEEEESRGSGMAPWLAGGAGLAGLAGLAYWLSQRGQGGGAAGAPGTSNLPPAVAPPVDSPAAGQLPVSRRPGPPNPFTVPAPTPPVSRRPGPPNPFTVSPAPPAVAPPADLPPAPPKPLNVPL